MVALIIGCGGFSAVCFMIYFAVAMFRELHRPRHTRAHIVEIRRAPLVLQRHKLPVLYLHNNVEEIGLRRKQGMGRR